MAHQLAASTPANTSPAPVVSIGSTAVAGTSTAVSPAISVTCGATAGDHQIRDRPLPFVNLGVVDHHHVGRRGEIGKLLRVGTGGEALTITVAPLC